MLHASLCRGHALRQPSERSVWPLRTSGTHSLPNDIRNASSLSTFRAKLKTHFLLLRTRDEHTNLRTSVLTFS